ncbi:MAG TPA: V-type ATPase subunit [Chloroflexi bacterium]|jgi:V/A-type H+-transporting ATPase subunit C|nr:V-type ATPase subunit [Chloroflexota bacterium]
MMAGGLSVLRYAGANARVRGLYSHLLDEPTWRHLRLSQDPQVMLEALKATAYGGLIDVQRVGFPGAEDLERRLWGRAALNCRRVMTFVDGPPRQLFLVWWQHFELENLKALFRGLDQNMEPEQIRRLLIPLGGYSTLPWQALLNERSVRGLIDRLANTHYINPLRAAYPLYQRERSLFALEVAMDIRYYRDLARAIEALGGSDREQARRVIGTRLDMLNILWAFRYRLYHELSVEEIVNYTLWHTIRTDADLVREIALGAEPAYILQRVWGGRAFDAEDLADLRADDARMLPRLEMLLERYWWQLARRESSGYPFTLGALLGYVVLQEIEVLDLITLLEAKIMGWPPERTAEYLIRSEE